MEVGGRQEGEGRAARLPWVGRNSLLILLLAALAQAETQVSFILISLSSSSSSRSILSKQKQLRYPVVPSFASIFIHLYLASVVIHSLQPFHLICHPLHHCLLCASLHAASSNIDTSSLRTKTMSLLQFPDLPSGLTRTAFNKLLQSPSCQRYYYLGFLVTKSLLHIALSSGAAELQGNRKSSSRDSLDKRWGEDRREPCTETGLFQLLQGKTASSMYHEII